MRRSTLGRSDLNVSQLCLGSMTWGTQNTLNEAHAQIDAALERGVNFIDTAEMYPVNPVSAENVGKTEAIIGEWIARTGRRDEVVIATKISGANGGFVRDGRGIDGQSMREAVDGSLKRLRTDVIDLYQLHWPNRGSFHFRQNWDFDPSGQNREQTIAHMREVLAVMTELRDAGKVRHFGLSNESTWGTAQWLRLAQEMGAPRMASIQNEYSLLYRHYDTDLAELAVNEDVTLLAYSPNAAGLLTGKYQGGTVVPDGSRMSFNSTLGGRASEGVWPAIAAYGEIALRHGLALPQMALAWCLTRPFQTVPIFGATSLAQLEVALGAVELELSPEVLAEINAVHKAHPMPF